MSVIVAYAKGGVVYMGADTQSTCGDRRFNGLCESDFKVRKLFNGMLLGFCGRVDCIQEVFAHREWFAFDKNFNLTKGYLVKNFIPKLIAYCDGNNMLDREEDFPCSFFSTVIGWRGKIFYISPTFKVSVHNDFKCLGSGAEYAVYDVAHIDPEKDVNQQLLKALRHAADRIESVSAPFVLIDSNKLEYKIEVK